MAAGGRGRSGSPWPAARWRASTSRPRPAPPWVGGGGGVRPPFDGLTVFSVASPGKRQLSLLHCFFFPVAKFDFFCKHPFVKGTFSCTFCLYSSCGVVQSPGAPLSGTGAFWQCQCFLPLIQHLLCCLQCLHFQVLKPPSGVAFSPGAVPSPGARLPPVPKPEARPHPKPKARAPAGGPTDSPTGSEGDPERAPVDPRKYKTRLCRDEGPPPPPQPGMPSPRPRHARSLTVLWRCVSRTFFLRGEHLAEGFEISKRFHP